MIVEEFMIVEEYERFLFHSHKLIKPVYTYITLAILHDLSIFVFNPSIRELCKITNLLAPIQ